MAKDRDFNWSLNMTIPVEDKEIIERWLKETGVSKTQFMGWCMNFFAEIMRNIDEFDLPADTKTTSRGWPTPIALLMGIKEGPLSYMKGNDNE